MFNPQELTGAGVIVGVKVGVREDAAAISVSVLVTVAG